MARARAVALALLLVGGCRPRQPVEPFGGPPLPAELNCGPERRYALEVAIASKDDFARLLGTTAIDPWLSLDDFKDPSSGRLDTGRVIAATEVSRLGDRIVYALDYHPARDCSPAQKHTVKATSDGHLSVYGCCGK